MSWLNSEIAQWKKRRKLILLFWGYILFLGLLGLSWANLSNRRDLYILCGLGGALAIFSCAAIFCWWKIRRLEKIRRMS